MATQTELDAIRAAYFTGVSEVTFKGRTTKYRSLSEMKQIIDALERDLGKSKPKSISVATDRGYR